jgi:thiamine pyrophosphokinase
MMNERPSALLICNGEMTSRRVLHSLAAQVDSIMCADGGANAARHAGLTPDTIIGDFDSITEDTRAHFKRAGVPFLHLERQDNTDFEKALILLRARGIRTVAVCGVTGRLLDHTLGNFSILLRYVDAFRIVLFDIHYRVDLITATAEFTSTPGDRISIVPLEAARGVHYSGLRYPFQGPLLATGVAEGTCNEALGDNFTVAMENGVLLVFRELHEAMWQL